MTGFVMILIALAIVCIRLFVASICSSRDSKVPRGSKVVAYGKRTNSGLFGRQV